MEINTQTQYLGFRNKLTNWLSDSLNHESQAQYAIFFSYGGVEKRCQVWNTAATDPKTAINRVLKFVEQLFEKNRVLPAFLKFDVVRNIEKNHG